MLLDNQIERHTARWSGVYHYFFEDDIDEASYPESFTATENPEPKIKDVVLPEELEERRAQFGALYLRIAEEKYRSHDMLHRNSLAESDDDFYDASLLTGSWSP